MKRSRPAAKRKAKNSGSPVKKTHSVRKRVEPVQKPQEQQRPSFMQPTFNIKSSTPLETEIDQLYDAIKENGSISLGKAVKKLGYPEEKIRDWADILEEHKMIDIDYPVVGEPVFKVKKTATQANKEEKEWKGIEEKVKEIDRKHKIKIPKGPAILAVVLGVSSVIFYMSGFRYALYDIITTLINQNPQVLDMITTIPFSDTIIQNIVHVVFGIYALAVVLVFFMIRFATGRRKK